MNPIVHYQNGNVDVTLNTMNGTKERFTFDDEFHPEFAESMDVTITYKCDGNCKFCYADCSPHGSHANLMSDYVVNTFIPSLHPYTELALNGNDLSHPQLYEFLRLLKDHNIIANLTVNQIHFMKNLNLLHKWQNENLFYGLGISLRDSSQSSFISEVKRFPNSVIHVVTGIFSNTDIENLKNQNIKILILGYKDKGRGEDFYNENIGLLRDNLLDLRNNLPILIDNDYFKVISFDNAAVSQLEINSLISKEDWNRYYMGDDGSFTFFVDLVNMKYARDSMTNQAFPISNMNSIEMFNSIHSSFTQ